MAVTLKVVEVLAPGPTGEGRTLGTAETLEDAHRIGDSGMDNPWYRIYCEGIMIMETRLEPDGHLIWDDRRQAYVPSDLGRSTRLGAD